MNIQKIIFVLWLAVSATSCASIVSQSTYKVSVTSTPDGARYEVKDETTTVHSGTTPSTVDLSASSNYTILFQKEGFRDETMTLNSSIDGWIFGNIFFFIWPMVIDFATGAAYKLPSGISMSLKPADGTNSNAAAPPTLNKTKTAPWPSLSTWKKGAPSPKDSAIIIAIEDYAFLPDVPGAVRNASDWESYFKDARGMKDVFVLTNQDAPIEEIKRFMGEAVKSSKKGGTIWFVFIGHGAANTTGTDGLLVGMDAQQTIESIESRSLAKADVVSTLTKKGRNAVMILDTCFSGKAASGALLAKGTQPVVPIIKPIKSTSRATIFSAAKAKQVAGQLTNEERPAFSYLLLGALSGWADDGDGNVTAEEAIEFTRRRLRIVKGRQQTPELEGKGGLILSKGAKEKDPGTEDLMQGK